MKPRALKKREPAEYPLGSALAGYHKGVAPGNREGKLELLVKVLANRYGALSQVVQKQLRKLSPEQLDDLLPALPDFQSKAELHRWLKERSSHVAAVSNLSFGRGGSLEFLAPDERRGFDNGFQVGQSFGRIAGKRELLVKFLMQRFRFSLADATKRMNQLSEPELDDLALDILDLPSKADLNHWLKENDS